MAAYKHWSNLPTSDDYCFVTTTIEDYLPVLAEPTNARMVLDALSFYRDKYAFLIHGFVVMPEHLHLMLKLERTVELGILMKDFKRYTARRIIQYCVDQSKADYLSAFERRGLMEGDRHSVWQRSYRSVPIVTPRSGMDKLRYIHHNPVRRGLVEYAEQWPYSSAGVYSGGEAYIRVDPMPG